MKIALMFSGQGAQKLGMGKDLYESSDIARALYDRADEILGWKVSEISFEGPEESLTETRVCQPALYAHGYAVYRILEARGALAGATTAMGLSLGELTALAAAEVFDFETGLRVVAERGRLMQEACEETDGSMAAVIGADREVVQAFCDEMGVEMANLNCPGQIVISGEKARIVAAVEAGRDRGFRKVVELKVAGAYHSRLMEPARLRFEAFLADVPLRAPRLTLLSNVTGLPVSDPEAIRAALANQVVSPVLWEDCMVNAAKGGANAFYELGIGGVLKGHAKRTNREWFNASFETWDDVCQAEPVAT